MSSKWVDDGESIAKVEGVWKPRHARKISELVQSEETKTEELLNAVRGILNKLTPQNYDKLLEKLQQLRIDTPDRLAQVVKLVFDKAVNEPMFSPLYARMSQQMSTKQVSSSENVVTFRKLLLIRCRKEFEKVPSSLVELEEKRKQLEAEENEKKRELESALNEMNAKNRRVTLGNIRFIGELFKLRMLTPRIMHSCVTRLLSTSDEESLECMCRLMSTIGKDLEQAESAGSASAGMKTYFLKLPTLTADKAKYSNRIRFMIQDLVELRQNDWKPRREDNNPKTIDQIHKEVEREREEQEYQNTMLDLRQNDCKPRRESFGQSCLRPNKQKSDSFRPKQHLSGFGSSSSVTPNRGGLTSGGGSLRPMGYMSSASMGPPMEGFIRYQALDDEGPPTFAPAKPANFGGRASTGGGAPAGRDYRSVGSTKSAILTDHKREGFHRGGTGYGSHGQQQPPFHQQQQHYQQREQHLQQDHLQQQRSQPPSRESSVPRMELKGPPSLTEDEAEKKTKAIVDEYINTEDLKEAVLSFSERFHHNTIASFVDLATNYKLDINDKERRLVGGLFRELIKQKLISKSKFLEGLSTLLATCDDYVVDMLRLWEYIAHIVGSVFMDGTLQLSVLEELAQPLVANDFSGKLVVAIFKEIAQQTSLSQLSKLWAASTPQLEKILRPGSRPEDLLKEQGLGYLVDGSASSSGLAVVWKPRHARKISELVQSEETKTEELLNAVRGILNKLTPQKYDTLLHKLQQLPIHTPDCLSSVVKLVFDKAVNEPMFSPLYARLCQSMSSVTVSFMTLLLIRSQKEFERVVASLVDIEEKLQQLKVEANEGGKNDPENASSDLEAKNRRVILGFIRFIGELFNMRIMTPRIMCSCIERLLSTPEEFSLECVCRLVSTVGKNLEQTYRGVDCVSFEMDLYFQKLEAISYGYSNRIRFMIQDLIDLRKSNWKPRREENKPKTIDEIHNELNAKGRQEQEY